MDSTVCIANVITHIVMPPLNVMAHFFALLIVNQDKNWGQRYDLLSHPRALLFPCSPSSWSSMREASSPPSPCGKSSTPALLVMTATAPCWDSPVSAHYQSIELDPPPRLLKLCLEEGLA